MTHGIGMQAAVMAQLQQQCEGMLCDGCCSIKRNVRHHDSTRTRGRNIDAVVSRAEHTHVAQAGNLFHHACRDRGLCSQRAVGARQPRRYIAGGSALVNVHFPQLPQLIPAQITGIETVPIKNDEFHSGQLTAFLS